MQNTQIQYLVQELRSHMLLEMKPVHHNKRSHMPQLRLNTAKLKKKKNYPCNGQSMNKAVIKLLLCMKHCLAPREYPLQATEDILIPQTVCWGR